MNASSCAYGALRLIKSEYLEFTVVSMNLSVYLSLLTRTRITCCRFVSLDRRAIHHGSLSPNTLLPTPPPLPALENAAQNAQAREWIQSFKSVQIPKAAVQLTFARSSGPGGQVCKDDRNVISNGSLPFTSVVP